MEFQNYAFPDACTGATQIELRCGGHCGGCFFFGRELRVMTPAPQAATPATPTVASTEAPKPGQCGPPDAQCSAHVQSAFAHGSSSNPEWYVKELGSICGITGYCPIAVVGRAQKKDFQRLFYCEVFGKQKKCGRPPCSCSNPPCNTCGGSAPTPSPRSNPVPTPGPVSGGGGGGSSPNAQVASWALSRHNTYRCLHCDTPEMVWDDGLAAEAASCAAGCPKGHTCPRNGAGENLYWSGFSGSKLETQNSWDDAIAAWYGEEIDWNYMTSASDGGVTGHFTAMVWRGTGRVGCAMNTQCNNKWSAYNNNVVVCRYMSAGNYANQYDANVKKLVRETKGCSPAATCTR